MYYTSSEQELRDQLNRIEQKLDMLLSIVQGSPQAPNQSASPKRPAWHDEIDQLLANARKIEAIKVYREHMALGLKEAKDAIDHWVSARSPAHASTPTPHDRFEGVRALMQQHQKIQAVKLYRELTGVGLAEAKAAVEAMGNEPMAW